MALDVRSFFIGIATVFGILAAGFGGGVLMGGVISGNDPQGPNKRERQQAAQQVPKATKPETPPVVAATPLAPATAQATPVPDLAPSPRVISPAQPVTVSQDSAPPQASPEPQPQPAAPLPQPQPAPQPRMTADAPALGPEKPVALVQPGDQQLIPPERLSRREERRLREQQRREERRAQRAERRLQEQMRREERQIEQAKRLRERDDDEDDEVEERPVVRRHHGLFDLPFFRPF